jgi:hypothetical protein
VFLQNRAAELVEPKKLKYALTVEVEYPQIIGLMQIVLHGLKMPAISLLGKIEWNLERNELADSLVLELFEEFRVVQGLVRCEDKQRSTRREEEERFHRTSSQFG